MELDKKTPRQNGFTLIEVLISLVVLSVGLAGMIPILVSTNRGNSFADITTETATWSQDKLEELRRESIQNLHANAGLTHSDQPDPGRHLTRGWKIVQNGDIYAIEVCTAKNSDYSSTCFSASPKASYHFFTIRTGSLP